MASLEQDHAGDDRGRAVGVQAGDLTALCVGHVGEAREQQFDGGEQQRVAVHARGVIGVELLVDGGGRGGGAGDGDPPLDRGALLGWKALQEDGAGVRGELLELLGRRRVGVDVALAHAHHAGLQRDVEAGGVVVADDELGGAAADVDDHGGLDGGLAVAHRAQERELGLFVAGERAGVEPIVPAHALGEGAPRWRRRARRR